MTAHHPLRQRLFLILELKGHKDKKAAWLFSWVLTLMVLSNVVAVILESVPAIHAQYGTVLAVFDTVSVLFFSVEYLLRIWTAAEKNKHVQHTAARRRLRYMLSFHGLVDLLAVLPFFLQSLLPGLDLRFLRVIRIMRILKLSHYSTALEDLIASIYAERDAFISALYLLALSILITSCLMHYAEHALQADKFGTIPDAMWWSIITITTVGYGDATPISAWGKVIGAFTALSGVFTVALLTGIKHLLHDEGMTIRGVQKILREQGVRHVAALSGIAPLPQPEPDIEAVLAREVVFACGGYVGLLERRLDAVIYRMKFAITVFASRQLVSHGHVKVNGRRVNIASYLVKDNDVIELTSKAKEMERVLEATQTAERDVPEYVTADHKDMKGTYVRGPKLADVPYPVQMEPSLVVEYYSR